MAQLQPDPKKLKTEISKPGFRSGIVSASRSAGTGSFEDFTIPVEDVTKEDFFPADFDFDYSKKHKADIHINNTCKINLNERMKQWTCPKYSEESVRDDIYSVLRDHKDQMNIQFPDNSLELENSRGGHGRVGYEYSEQQFQTIFTEHAARWGEDISPIQEKEQGLVGHLKLLSSKPGLCVLRGREIVVGGINFKHNKLCYDMNWAKRQCAVYCYGVLYYYRVFLGIPLDRVYGFYVDLPGPSCHDLTGTDQQYAVGIMEVVSPTFLGGTYEASQYRELFDITSSDGLQLLIQFLKDGKRASIDDIARNHQIPKENRGPFRFSLPAMLWGPDQDNHISIVRGGTAAMVFKLPRNRLSEFLKKYIICNENSNLRWKRWMKRNLSAQDGGAAYASDEFVYLKVRTKDTTVRFREGFQAMWREIKEEADDPDSKGKQTACTEFLGTYIIEPFETATFSMCIMADRGKPLHSFMRDVDMTPKKMSQLESALEELKCNAYCLAGHILHSDILVHNIVVDDKTKLHLVDYDEGFGVDKSLPRRFLDPDPNKDFEWLEAMFYPNSLRHFGKRYTQVQLLALMFLSLYGVRSPDSCPYTKEMKQLGTILKDAFSKNNAGWEHKGASSETKVLPKELLGLIDLLWEKLPKSVASTIDL